VKSEANVKKTMISYWQGRNIGTLAEGSEKSKTAIWIGTCQSSEVTDSVDPKN